MPFDNLAEEVDAEFSGLTTGLAYHEIAGYGLTYNSEIQKAIRDNFESRKNTEISNKKHAAKMARWEDGGTELQMAEVSIRKKEAVLRTKNWRIKALEDPITAKAYLERAAANYRAYYQRNKDKEDYKRRQGEAQRRRRDKILSNPDLHAVWLAKHRAYQTTKRRERGAATVVRNRMSDALGWIKSVGEVRAADIQRHFSIGIKWSAQILFRLERLGSIVRISHGLYVANKSESK